MSKSFGTDLTKSQKTQAALLSIGSGVTGLLSGFAGLQASTIQARQFKTQRIFNELAVSQEKLRARENAVFLRKKFLANIGSANASFAARGVSTSSGVGRRFTIESLRVLGEDLQANELSSASAQDALTLRASQARVAEQTARNIGLLTSTRGLSKNVGSILTGFKTLRQKGDIK